MQVDSDQDLEDELLVDMCQPNTTSSSMSSHPQPTHTSRWSSIHLALAYAHHHKQQHEQPPATNTPPRWIHLALARTPVMPIGSVSR